MRGLSNTKSVSVVIPTLWRSDCIIDLVNHLLNWNQLKELIIIDNDPNRRPQNECWENCTILEQENNIFVNPAWNLGAATATGQFLAICNDDILFKPDDVSVALKALRKNEIIGLHRHSLLNPERVTSTSVVDGFNIGLGWGCLMLMRKKTFVPIPHTIKVWYGDDWLVHSIGRKSSLQIKVHGNLSVSASDEAFNPIKEEDNRQYYQFIWSPVYRPLRILARWGLKQPLQVAINIFNRRNSREVPSNKERPISLTTK